MSDNQEPKADRRNVMATAKCSRCPYKVRLKKDGTIGSHQLWSGNAGPFQCKGSGLPPRVPAQ